MAARARGLAAAAAGLVLAVAGAVPALAEGVIKGGTVVVAPGTQVEGLGNIRPGPGGDAIEIDCQGGRSFKLATGTAQGSCSASTGPTGDVESARCDDGANAAVAICGLDNGAGGCSVTIGLGTCQAD